MMCAVDTVYNISDWYGMMCAVDTVYNISDWYCIMCAAATVTWLIFYNSSFCTRNICTVSSDDLRARIQVRTKDDVDN